MRQRVILILSYCFFWILFFLVSRLLFLVYHYESSSTLSLLDFLLVNFHGLHIDLSAMGYVAVIPVLLISLLRNGKVLHYSLATYTFIFLALASMIVVIDLELYRHWDFRMDSTPLLYISPEAVKTNAITSTLLLLGVFSLFFPLSIYSYQKTIGRKTATINNVSWKESALLFCIAPLLIIPIRGSFGIAPMKVSKVYFHESNNFANHAAINVLWNVGYDLKKIKDLNYPKDFFDADKTQLYSKKIFIKPEASKKLINSHQPNVILIILESYTYKLLEPLGGLPGVTPNLNQIAKEGVLFSNFYSSGDRTDKGLVTIISGYPAQTQESIIKFPKKISKLPSLAQNLKSIGYQTSFTYGGDLDFANFKSYLLQVGFESLISEDDFPEQPYNSKWGVHDHIVFDRFLEDQNNSRRPFFNVLLTLSSHEPFDVPMETVFEGTDDASKFLNSAHYTDRALGDFIRKAKKESWWDSTLVIITADHGHRLPDNKHKDRFKIPMLWTGGALAVRDTVIHSLGDQTDIANTLLNQLDAYDPGFIFSRDILSPNYNPLAVYVYKNGFGYIKGDKVAEYDMIQNRYIYTEGELSTEDYETGKAYLQILFNDYNSR